MSRFRRDNLPRFGGPPATSSRRPCTAKLERRRAAMLKTATEAVAVLPGRGEAVHCLMTGYYDLMHVLVLLAERLGPIQRLRIATLSYNARNLAELVRLLEERRVESLTLLCSSFFKDHNKDLFARTQEAFAARPARVSADRSHCKVVCVQTAEVKLVLEGSANLRTNRNIEQLTLIHQEEIHDWHATWIDAKVGGTS